MSGGDQADYVIIATATAADSTRTLPHRLPTLTRTDTLPTPTLFTDPAPTETYPLPLPNPNPT